MRDNDLDSYEVVDQYQNVNRRHCAPNPTNLALLAQRQAAHMQVDNGDNSSQEQDIGEGEDEDKEGLCSKASSVSYSTQ